MWVITSSVLLPSITACLLSNISGPFSAFVVRSQMSNKHMTIEDEPDKLSLHAGQNTVTTQCFRPVLSCTALEAGRPAGMLRTRPRPRSA